MHSFSDCGRPLRARWPASGSERSKLAPATASPMIIMTGPSRSSRASSDGRSASVPWKRRRSLQAGVLDHGDGGVGRQAGRDQPAGDVGGDRAAHIDGDRGAGDGKPRPVGQRVALEVVAGGEHHRRGDAAQRQRQFEIGGGGEGRGDARHDLIGNAGLAQRRHLLAGAAEHQRIAGLQPHDALALAAEFDQQRIDLALRSWNGSPCACRPKCARHRGGPWRRPPPAPARRRR